VNVDAFEDHCWRDLVPREIVDVYRFYRRETFVGPRPALLAIDLYNLVFEGGPRPVAEVVQAHPSSCGVHAWSAIAPLQELFALARSRGLPIFYTTVETRKEAGPGQVRATNRAARVGDDAYRIREEFRSEPGDVVIYKERASAFFGTPLIAHLHRRGVESLIVCGESTSGCVRASVVDAYSYGFHTVVVEEGCFDRSPLSHAINLFDMHHKYADVMHLAELKRHLGAREDA
jgi:nicotinamidase-related amidase